MRKLRFREGKLFAFPSSKCEALDLNLGLLNHKDLGFNFSMTLFLCFAELPPPKSSPKVNSNVASSRRHALFATPGWVLALGGCTETPFLPDWESLEGMDSVIISVIS